MALVFLLSVTLALISAAIPWLARPLRGRSLLSALVVGLVIGCAAAVIGAVRALPLLPVTDLMVLVVAWSGGLLLGRGMAARFSPFLLLFLCLSVLDVLLAVGGYPQTPHTSGNSSPLVSANFVLGLPWGQFQINVADLLLLTAVAEHWRRRGGGYGIAVLTGVLGFLLADVVVEVTGLVQLPGFPFFTAGYLGSEGVYRSRSRDRTTPGVPVR
jgi:hypothetical protein